MLFILINVFKISIIERRTFISPINCLHQNEIKTNSNWLIVCEVPKRTPYNFASDYVQAYYRIDKIYHYRHVPFGNSLTYFFLKKLFNLEIYLTCIIDYKFGKFWNILCKFYHLKTTLKIDRSYYYRVFVDLTANILYPLTL